MSEVVKSHMPLIGVLLVPGVVFTDCTTLRCICIDNDTGKMLDNHLIGKWF